MWSRVARQSCRVLGVFFFPEGPPHPHPSRHTFFWVVGGCRGLWSVLATRLRAWRPAGFRDSPLHGGGLYSSLGKDEERQGTHTRTHTREKNVPRHGPPPPQKTRERRQSRRVALSRPIAAVNAPMLTAIRRTEFVIKGKRLTESAILSLFLFCFFFLGPPLYHKETQTHTRTPARTHAGRFLSPETTCTF